MDAVQKVEAAFMAGTSAARTYDAFGPLLFSSGATAVSASLAPPAGPVLQFATGSLLLALFVNGLACMVGLVAIFMLISPEAAKNPAMVRTAVLMFVGAVAALVFLGVPLWVFHRRRQAKLDAIYGKQATFHRHMYHVWEQLYFCSRDHVVFSPLTQNWEDLRGMHRLIREEAERYFGRPQN